MKLRILCLALALAGLAPGVAGAVQLQAAHPQDIQAVSAARTAEGKLVVDVWTDRGDGSVYRIGDPIKIHFRASRDCYVLIYNVDTEGLVHLLYPSRRLDPHWVIAGREYVLPGPHSSYALSIEGPPGVEYVQALASLEPFQQLPVWMDPDAAPADYDPSNSDWRDSGTVVGDPYVGMERINRGILPYDCDEEDCYSAAYTSYYVERKVAYPRYLCADCHGPSADAYYDPYGVSCPVFEVRVDYDWRWRRHWPFYGNPYWYYYRRSDCPPQYFSFKTRWSSNDGWIRFRDSFGEKVLWKKNPGQDIKAGNDTRWRERGDGSSPPRGSFGGGGGLPTPPRASGGSEPPVRGSFGGSRERARTQPIRVPIQPVAPTEQPVRFRSRSRDVALPTPPRVDIRQQTPTAQPSQPRQSEGRDRAQEPTREEPRRQEPARQEPAREQPRREEPPRRQDPPRAEPRQEPARESAPSRSEQSRPAEPKPTSDRSGRAKDF